MNRMQLALTAVVGMALGGAYLPVPEARAGNTEECDNEGCDAEERRENEGETEMEQIAAERESEDELAESNPEVIEEAAEC